MRLNPPGPLLSTVRMDAVTLPKHATLVQKWRKPVSLVFAIFGVTVAVFTAPPGLASARGLAPGWQEACKLIGILLLNMAALGRVWSLAYVAGRKNRELCQTGPYSMTRNPLYFFSFLGVVGFALALPNIPLALVGGVCFLSYYAGVIRGEEGRLRLLHGSAFDAYCTAVPRFWPKRGIPPVSGESLQLNLGPFTRGLREVFGFLASILLADAIGWAHRQQLWPTLTLPF
jgi:protein-S-isoprenylcysteine O-methyltransferase Ste14